MSNRETRQVQRLYERDAARYDRIVSIAERTLLDDGRVWAAAQATGDVLEPAMGTGRNLPFYARDVRLTGGDISHAMIRIANDRAQSLGRAVRLLVGDAQQLAFNDEAFDTVVSTLSLCTIPDERRALREAWRVLRPGGRLILLEHVRATSRLLRIVQRLAEPLAHRWAGDHLLRDPLDLLAQVGFIVEHSERRRAGIIERVVARKVATARRSGEAG